MPTMSMLSDETALLPHASGQAGALPAGVAEVFAYYLTDGRRDLSTVAAHFAAPLAQVVQTFDDYALFDRAAHLDAQAERAALAHTRALLASTLPDSAATLVQAASSRYESDRYGRAMPPIGRPTPNAVRSALAHMGIFGISPVRLANIRTQSVPSSEPVISDAELDALVAAGDTDTLIALALGRPLPGPGTVSPDPPEDFPKAQPGGRVVPAVPRPPSGRIELVPPRLEAAADGEVGFGLILDGDFS